MWDIVGKTPHPLDRGSDEPGRISVIPGGVAMNIAMALRRFDLPVTLLTCLGQDRDGDTLIVEAAQRGIRTDFVYRAPDLSTDRYIAIEDETGMIAAVADAHSLEQGADKLLAPLHDGRLGSTESPWTGMIILDGNFRTEQLTELAQSPALRQADIRLAPAPPGQSRRPRPFPGHPNPTRAAAEGMDDLPDDDAKKAFVSASLLAFLEDLEAKEDFIPGPVEVVVFAGVRFGVPFLVGRIYDALDWGYATPEEDPPAPPKEEPVVTG